MKLIAMPSGPLTPIGYDPISGYPPMGPCASVPPSPVNWYKWYNYDVQSNSALGKKVATPDYSSTPLSHWLISFLRRCPRLRGGNSHASQRLSGTDGIFCLSPPCR
jgi:hypothetical protein